jgi:hypothetical protein
MKLVWKDSTDVGIGYFNKGTDNSFVAIWLGKTGKTAITFADHRTVSGSTSTPNQVGKNCMKDDTSTPPVKYNDCFNQQQLTKTNALRYEHLSDSVKIDGKFAANLQK